MGTAKPHSADTVTVGQLHFKELPLDGARSLFGSVSDANYNGIYAYEFTDGTWYVGLAKDVRKRHAQHLEEYRHKKPPLVMKRMFFAEVPAGNRKLLDRSETEAIAWFESQEGVSLNNIAKTSQPLGTSTATISIGGAFGIAIPWERSKRNGRPSQAANLAVYEDGEKAERFSRFQSLPDAAQVLSLASAYVAQTIAAPAASVGVLWTATAFPGSNAKAALRITCGNLETFVINEDGSGFINFKMSKRAGKFSKLQTYIDHRAHAFLLDFPAYKLSGNLAGAPFSSPGQLEKLLDSEKVLDACYAINAELMRRGPSMNQAATNGYLCEALLSAPPGA